MAISRSQLLALADSLEPTVRKAFIEAVENLRDGVDLKRVVEALEAGNIEAALTALHIEPAAFDPLDRALTEAYRRGGVASAEAMPTVRNAEGGIVRIRFNGRDPEAENWLREFSSNEITNIVEDQRESIRSVLTTAMEAGKGPTSVARDIAGRVNPATGKREGSLLGLTQPQTAFVRDYEAELRSGDPALLRRAMERGRRDARFDRALTKAIEGKEPLDAATIQRMISRYKDRLLDLRGATIARFEAHAAVFAARHESYRQAVASGAVREDQITRTWRDSADVRVRHSHVSLNGQVVKGLTRPFISPATGARIMYPCDPKAPADETIGCRCDVTYRFSLL